MIEYIAYIFLFSLGFITLLTENKSILKYLYIPFVFVFMLIVRLNAFVLGGNEKDILTYAIEMKNLSFSFYYVREFIFWNGIQLLYALVQSELVTFILLDYCWIRILLKTANLNDDKQLASGFVVVLMTSFPFFFGYENIYRQFFAGIVLLYAYAHLKENELKSWRLFIVSIFIHNLSLFLLPIFILKKNMSFGIKDRVIISLVLSIFIVFSIPLLLHFKSTGSTGLNLSILYFLLFSCFLGLFLYKFKDNILHILGLMPSLLPSVVLMMGFILFKQEMITERVGMLFIIFLIYDLYAYSSLLVNKLTRVAFRILLLLLFGVPVFVFRSSLDFLF
jgi:hypothetical protein